MAQLNDLLVMGQSTVLGPTKILNTLNVSNIATFSSKMYLANTLRIGNTTTMALDGNWCEGIRINAPDDQWVTIALGATTETGTTENMWSLHRTSAHDFAIARAESSGSSGMIIKKDGKVGFGITTPSYKLDVNGTGNFREHLYANNGLTWTNAYWTAPGNIICNKNGDYAEFSFDMGAGTQWHVWSTVATAGSMLSCFADSKYVQVHHHLQVGDYVNDSYKLTTDSFICNSWIRTKGKTGWYNEDYGGGWYMEDATYVRAYNNKAVYVSNT